MTTLDLPFDAPRRAGPLAALLRLLAAVEMPRLRRPSPRLPPHLLRDIGLTPADYDGF